MAWFKFDRAYDFKPTAKPQVTIAYPPGTYNVTKECADKAAKAGAGKPVKATKTDGE